MLVIGSKNWFRSYSNLETFNTNKLLGDKQLSQKCKKLITVNKAFLIEPSLNHFHFQFWEQKDRNMFF